MVAVVGIAQPCGLLLWFCCCGPGLWPEIQYINVRCRIMLGQPWVLNFGQKYLLRAQERVKQIGCVFDIVKIYARFS